MEEKAASENKKENMKSRMITIMLAMLCAGVLAAAAFTVTGYVRYFAGEDGGTAADPPANDPTAELNGNKDTCPDNDPNAELNGNKDTYPDNDPNAELNGNKDTCPDNDPNAELNGNKDTCPDNDPNAGMNGNKDTGDPSDIHGAGNTDSGGKKENSEDYEFKGSFGEFTAQTFAGGTFSESSFSACGVNLVNVWTTFCSPCIKEMPELNELSEEYAGTVQVIGICADTADENGKPSEKLLELGKKIAEEDLSLSYTMLVPSGELQKGVLKDVYAYPTTYITDDAGNIYEVIVGRKSREEFAGLLEKYIKP